MCHSILICMGCMWGFDCVCECGIVVVSVSIQFVYGGCVVVLVSVSIQVNCVCCVCVLCSDARGLLVMLVVGLSVGLQWFCCSL